jgi:hypothetical protein
MNQRNQKKDEGVLSGADELMLVFGHIGITAGVFKVCETIFSRDGANENNEPVAGLQGNAVSDCLKSGIHLSGIKNLAGKIDYRMVIIGSVLPDLIDKPLFLLFGNSLELSGRDYAHTLILGLLLLIGGLVLNRYGRPWLLVVSLSSFMHLVLDRIWNKPVTLLWPLMGPLRGETIEGWITDRWYSIFTVPEVYIPEIIGLAILLAFFIRLIKNKGITGFLKNGIVE